MATSAVAEILLRYDDDQERQHFETLFGDDFAIQAFASDQTALDHLASASTLPAAIVLMVTWNRPCYQRSVTATPRS